MKKLLLLVVVVAALLPVCLATQLATPKGPNATSSAPHSSSVTSVLKPNATTVAHNVTNTTTPTVPATTASNTTTAPQPEKKTSAKPTSVKPVSPSVTTVTSKATLPSSSATVTPKGAAARVASSGFSAGSFIGGIILTLGLLAVGYVGCRTYHAKRGVQYRTIDEHDAII